MSYNIGVDIDNTLTCTPAPWNKTSSKDMRDEEIANQLLKAEKRLGVEILNECNMKIILVTTRHEDYRDVTTKWLEHNSIKYHELIMRKNRFTGGTFKLNEYLQHKVNSCLENDIKYMLDDDEYIVDTLNNCGIIAVKVDKKGRFDDAYIELLNKIYQKNQLLNTKYGVKF